MALSKGWYSPPRWLVLVSLLSITFSTWTLNWLPQGFSWILFFFFILHTHTSQSPLPPWTHLLFIFFQLPNLYSFWFLLILSCMVDISTWSCGSDVTRVQLYTGTSYPKLNSTAAVLMAGRDTSINLLAQFEILEPSSLSKCPLSVFSISILIEQPSMINCTV